MPALFPPTLALSSPDVPERVSSYNLSELHRSGHFMLRLLRSPGMFINTKPTKGLHEIGLSLSRNWLEAQHHCTNIGEAKFLKVDGMVDPATNTPLVALVSPFYERGSILEVEATRRQKVRWLIQICDAVQHLHEHDIVHANIHTRNILIRDDGLAVLTDACLYSLIVERYIAKMSPDQEVRLGPVETICCKTAATVREDGGKTPAKNATKEDDIFGLGMSIWIVLKGNEPWSGRSAPALVHEYGHRGLLKPDGMGDRLWEVLQAIFSQSGTPIATVEDIKQRLREEIN